VTVQATPVDAASGKGSSSAATVDVGLTYSGPGTEAERVEVAPGVVVLAPGGGASLAATVFGAGDTVIVGVPVAYVPERAGVVAIDASGAITTLGEGATRVVVSTPTGLEAQAWVYVVEGVVAYVASGSVLERAAAGGEARVVGEGIMPAYTPDASGLYVVRSGGVREIGSDAELLEGTFPSVSPDGTKLAVDRSGSVVFANIDGSHETVGPAGSTPVWEGDGAHLVVGGGSIERVRADGSERTVVVEGEARWPAVSAGGVVAYASGDALRIEGVEGNVLPAGEAVRSRPAWSPSGAWVAVSAGADGGLWLVAADGSAPAVSLGTGEALYPAWRPVGEAVAPAALTLTGLSPEQPTPGGEAELLGSGFDWIIPANDRVFFPTREGSVEAEVLGVREGAVRIRVPRRVAAGSIRATTGRARRCWGSSRWWARWW